jgi:hypothetical protein
VPVANEARTPSHASRVYPDRAGSVKNRLDRFFTAREDIVREGSPTLPERRDRTPLSEVGPVSRRSNRLGEMEFRDDYWSPPRDQAR